MWRSRKAESPKLDEFGRSELHYAALEGRIDVIRRFVSKGYDPNTADVRGLTPLHFAVRGGSLEAVQMLLQEFSVVVDPRDRDGNTPLCDAVFNYRGDPAVINQLRSLGADPFLKNEHGVSSVALANSIGNYDVAKHFADLSPGA
jgi:uncharacterized protein